jgi:hypothetical protein
MIYSLSLEPLPPIILFHLNDDSGNDINNAVAFIELLLCTCFANISHLIFMTSKYLQCISLQAFYCKILQTNINHSEV